MCLKFLLEANPENQKLVSSLEARDVVPNGPSGKAELERMGVDVSLNEDGKVKISSRASGSGSTSANPGVNAAPRSASLARRNEKLNRYRERERSARERFDRLDSNDGQGDFDEAVDFM